MKKGTVVFLNGVSSAGKSTLAKAFQLLMPTPFYRICCDDFMHMTPRHILHDDFDNQLNITQGIMKETVMLFVSKGYNVVLDEVVLNLPDKNDWLYDYCKLLDNYPVLMVNVVCPLEELRRRELIRGDRGIGGAENGLNLSYTDLPYDLTVDTFKDSIHACAEKIKEKLDNPERWTALRTIKTNIEESREKTS